MIDFANTANTVSVREKGRQTYVEPLNGVENIIVDESRENVLGWFSNKHNPFGWSVHKLSEYDVKWIESVNNTINLDNVYRVYSDKGTSIVRFNLKTGTYAFADNEYLMETDNIKFHKAVKFREFIIDYDKQEHFNV